jgi:hypothetical protein
LLPGSAYSVSEAIFLSFSRRFFAELKAHRKMMCISLYLGVLSKVAREMDPRKSSNGAPANGLDSIRFPLNTHLALTLALSCAPSLLRHHTLHHLIIFPMSSLSGFKGLCPFLSKTSQAQLRSFASTPSPLSPAFSRLSAQAVGCPVMGPALERVSLSSLIMAARRGPHSASIGRLFSHHFGSSDR